LQVSIACGQTEIFTEFERKYLSLFRITVTVVAIVAYVPIILRMRKVRDFPTGIKFFLPNSKIIELIDEEWFF
jgi:hypothetical protein